MSRPSRDNHGPFEDQFEVPDDDSAIRQDAAAEYLVLAAGSGRLDLTDESLHVHRTITIPRQTSIADENLVSDLAANSKDCCGLLPGKQSIHMPNRRKQNRRY